MRVSAHRDRISPTTVARAFADARSLGLDAATVEALTDVELEAKLLSEERAELHAARARPRVAAHRHIELRRPGVTLALLHVEFLTAHPDDVRYTALCERYRTWANFRASL